MNNDDLDAFLRRGTNYRGGAPEYYEDTHDNYGNYVGDRSSHADYQYKPFSSAQPYAQQNQAQFQPQAAYQQNQPTAPAQAGYTNPNTGYTQLPPNGGQGFSHSLDRDLANPPKFVTHYEPAKPDNGAPKAVPLPNTGGYISPRMYQNIVLYSPKNAADVEKLIDYLCRKEPAIVDLDPIADSPDAQRVLDFTSGAVYALGGRILSIKSNTFLIVPDGIDVAKPEDHT
ncbi:MAG: cell division protein SepF [Clostridiales bacterium]|nr:cell division protein SepF [Clostridiales bacterium]